MRFVIALSCFLILHNTEIAAQHNFRIMFYNVENLFDTHDDPEKDDNDFLPEGFMRWTEWKYWKKLRNVAKVITAVGGMQSPAIVGLCEIENDSVLFDLTKRTPLRAQEYEYIITNSPDTRGIDVAILYQPDQFKPLQIKEYQIQFKHNKAKPTRNILHVAGEIISQDTIDLFVCHFPSRSGGQRETEPARVETALLLKNKVDSLQLLRKNAHIVIMGDFNDHPNNKSLSVTLGAKGVHNPIEKDALYNLFLHRVKETRTGTYKYQGKWEILDQFIVNGVLLSESHNLHLEENTAHIFDAEFLLEDDEKHYGKKPFRTNLGPRYKGGFSDHLPIYIDISVNM